MAFSTLLLAVFMLFFSGIYLLLHRGLIRKVLGIITLGNGVNLSILLLSPLHQGRAALIAQDAERMQGVFSDPLPQALVLTAIVIGLALTVFLIALLAVVANTPAPNKLESQG